jgi:hypothetical protein
MLTSPMNKAMIPISPNANVTALLQVWMIPSARWMRYPGAVAPTVATLTVSPALPVTIVEKISLSAGTHTYRAAATRIETRIKAAHILLKAMPQININCLISPPKQKLYGFTSRDRRIAECWEIDFV